MAAMNTKPLIPQSFTRQPAMTVAVAACSFALAEGGEIQLLPAGEFRAVDGRPNDAPCWLTNADIAARLIADIDGRTNSLVIDYEHQTLLCTDNGQPAPAAGWFKSLRWVDAVGLFATVEWTERAAAHIAAGEYRFISPVIAYDKATGAIKKIINAALTNNPAIDGMESVSARLTAEFTQKEKLTMDIDELLEQLRWLLNLPTLTTPEEVAAELQKAVTLIKADIASDTSPATAAAGFSITGLLSSKNNQLAALKSASADPAKYVPVEVMASLQTELAALRAEKVSAEVDGVVTAALSVGKLLPAQEAWARELGKSNMVLLRQHVDTAQPVAALTGTQTQGKPPAGQEAHGLSESELAMCRSMGTAPEDFKKTKDSVASL